MSGGFRRGKDTRHRKPLGSLSINAAQLELRHCTHMEMNWMLVCCCLYLYSKKKSEEDTLLEEKGSKYRHFKSLRSGLVWMRDKKVMAGSNHDQLHQTLGKEVTEPRPRHIYTQPLLSSGPTGRKQSPESASLVKRIGRRLYKTFEKDKERKVYQETVAHQQCEQSLESPFDSFEVTESFEREETHLSTPGSGVTSSITNRTPHVASQYQNMPQSYLPAHSEHRYTENWRQSRPSIPPPPARCYLNQAYADRGGRGVYGGVDSRRQVRSYQ